MDNILDANNALVETFSAKKAPEVTIAPIEKEKEKTPLVYAPEIPNVKFDTSIPAEVKSSMDQTQALAAQKRTAEKMRQDELIQTIQQSQNIINDAEMKIEKSRNHIFGELIGMFSDAIRIRRCFFCIYKLCKNTRIEREESCSFCCRIKHDCHKQ